VAHVGDGDGVTPDDLTDNHERRAGGQPPALFRYSRLTDLSLLSYHVGMALPLPPKPLRELKPSRQSVKLGGQCINLVRLSETMQVDHGYLSRVMRGDRVPSLPYAEAVAAALGWTLQQLMDAIRQRAKD
jgi:hypothetical protein